MAEWKTNDSNGCDVREMYLAGIDVMIWAKKATPAMWLLECQPWFISYPLASMDETPAKAEAIQLVREKLQQALAELGYSTVRVAAAEVVRVVELYGATRQGRAF